jgi:hypothetical protein
VREQDDPRPVAAQVFDGGQRRKHTDVVTDTAIGFERNIEIDADEGALAPDKRVLKVS